MSKTLPAIVGTLLIAGMSIFTFYQLGIIEDQDHTILEQDKEIDFLNVSLKNEVEANGVLLGENIALRDQIDLLSDSIVILQDHIIKLEKTIRGQKKAINSFKSKLRAVEQQYQAIKTEIAELVRKEEVDRTTIANLEADKASLRDEISNLNVKKDEIEQAQIITEAELLDQKVSEARFRRITKLVNETKVRFNKVTLTTKRFGKAIKKIKKENTKWKYTVLEFFLENEDLKLLLDEQFIVKIVDSDSGEVLSYIESNPNFPDSEMDTKGVNFKFDGNMIEVSYYNNQKKAGDNYEVQIFYLSDGEEYLLLDGAKPFIQNRKVMDIN